MAHTIKQQQEKQKAIYDIKKANENRQIAVEATEKKIRDEQIEYNIRKRIEQSQRVMTGAILKSIKLQENIDNGQNLGNAISLLLQTNYDLMHYLTLYTVNNLAGEYDKSYIEDEQDFIGHIEFIIKEQLELVAAEKEEQKRKNYKDDLMNLFDQAKNKSQQELQEQFLVLDPKKVTNVVEHVKQRVPNGVDKKSYSQAQEIILAPTNCIHNVNKLISTTRRHYQRVMLQELFEQFRSNASYEQTIAFNNFMDVAFADVGAERTALLSLMRRNDLAAILRDGKVVELIETMYSTPKLFTVKEVPVSNLVRIRQEITAKCPQDLEDVIIKKAPNKYFLSTLKRTNNAHITILFFNETHWYNRGSIMNMLSPEIAVSIENVFQKYNLDKDEQKKLVSYLVKNRKMILQNEHRVMHFGSQFIKSNNELSPILDALTLFPTDKQQDIVNENGEYIIQNNQIVIKNLRILEENGLELKIDPNEPNAEAILRNVYEYVLKVDFSHPHSNKNIEKHKLIMAFESIPKLYKMEINPEDITNMLKLPYITPDLLLYTPLILNYENLSPKTSKCLREIEISHSIADAYTHLLRRGTQIEREFISKYFDGLTPTSNPNKYNAVALALQSLTRREEHESAALSIENLFRSIKKGNLAIVDHFLKIKGSWNQNYIVSLLKYDMSNAEKITIFKNSSIKNISEIRRYIKDGNWEKVAIVSERLSPGEAEIVSPYIFDNFNPFVVIKRIPFGTPLCEYLKEELSPEDTNSFDNYRRNIIEETLVPEAAVRELQSLMKQYKCTYLENFCLCGKDTITVSNLVIQYDNYAAQNASYRNIANELYFSKIDYAFLKNLQKEIACCPEKEKQKVYRMALKALETYIPFSNSHEQVDLQNQNARPVQQVTTGPNEAPLPRLNFKQFQQSANQQSTMKDKIENAELKAGLQNEKARLDDQAQLNKDFHKNEKPPEITA